LFLLQLVNPFSKALIDGASAMNLSLFA